MARVRQANQQKSGRQNTSKSKKGYYGSSSSGKKKRTGSHNPGYHG